MHRLPASLPAEQLPCMRVADHAPRSAQQGCPPPRIELSIQSLDSNTVAQLRPRRLRRRDVHGEHGEPPDPATELANLISDGVLNYGGSLPIPGVLPHPSGFSSTWASGRAVAPPSSCACELAGHRGRRGEPASIDDRGGGPGYGRGGLQFVETQREEEKTLICLPRRRQPKMGAVLAYPVGA